MSDDTPSQGKGAFLSGALVFIGLIAAKHPDWARVVFVAQHSDQVASLVGYVIAAVGQFGLFISHPPTWLRAPLEKLKAHLIRTTP